MKYIAIAETDIGITKDTNQDSLCVKHILYKGKEVLMAVICDGMGGLAKGELASATVIRAFSQGFADEVIQDLEDVNMQKIADKWVVMLRNLNIKIQEYGIDNGVSLGTTFTGILFVENKYLIVHVGDTRVYEITTDIHQLTTDQTFIAREVSKGTLTWEQAKSDKRRNMLLQCVGASKMIEPQIVFGTAQKGAYLLCSDGFRHEITDKEIYKALCPTEVCEKEIMQIKVRELIETVKQRMEKDNISAIWIKAD